MYYVRSLIEITTKIIISIWYAVLAQRTFYCDSFARGFTYVRRAGRIIRTIIAFRPSTYMPLSVLTFRVCVCICICICIYIRAYIFVVRAPDAPVYIPSEDRTCLHLSRSVPS